MIVWLRPLLELRLLLAVLLLGALAWMFIELAEEVVEGDTHAIDEALLLGLRTAADPAVPIGPAWLQVVMRDITALGGYTILTLVTAATVVYLFLVHRPRTVVFILILCSARWTVLFKLGYARPRPDLVPYAVRATSASFLSGHSSGAAAVYLTLGVMASFQERRRQALHHGPRRRRHPAGRHLASLSRRALALGRARRLGARCRLGRALLAGGRLLAKNPGAAQPAGGLTAQPASQSASSGVVDCTTSASPSAGGSRRST